MKSIEKKRWDETEIKRAARIILKAEKNKTLFIKILDEIVHWILVLIIIIGNIIIGSFIVFASNLLNTPYFYLVIILIAVSFGLLIEIPLRDIEKLDKNKHFISRIMLPLLAIINIYFLIGIQKTISSFSEINFEFNAVTAGIVYGIFLLLPHVINSILRKMKKRVAAGTFKS